MTQENFENAKPGQFVHANNESDLVCGFISAKDVDRYEIEICTFHPVELPKNTARVVRETMTMDECSDLLRSAIGDDPDIKQAWSDAIGPG